MYRKNGFTLVELLAVIVILAIILAIAIPSISGLIETTRKNAFEENVKLIIKAIENKRAIDNTYSVVGLNTDNIEADLGINNGNYESISSFLEDDKVNVSVVGKNKWENLSACGTRTVLTISEGSICSINPPSAIADVCLSNGHLDNAGIANLISDGYIPIASASDLNQVRQDGASLTFGAGTAYAGTYVAGLDKKYIQIKDIDLSIYSSGVGWVPLGSDGLVETGYSNLFFTGKYNGNCYKINNLTINRPGDGYLGLFGQTDTGSEISNVIVDGGNIIGDSIIGGIVGLNYDATISNSYFTGAIVGENQIGGIAGCSYYTSMTNVYVNGNFTGIYWVGGIVGDSTDTHIKNAVVKADFTGGDQVGGVVGYADETTVLSVEVTGNFTGGNQVGGAIGYGSSSSFDNITTSVTVESSHKWGEIGGIGGYLRDSTLSNSHSSSNILGTGTLANAGGLVGDLTDSDMINCSSSGTVNSYKSAGGLVGALFASQIIGSYSTSAVTVGSINAGGLVGSVNATSKVKRSYATGDVTGGTSIGGLVGENSGQISDTYSSGAVTATISNLGGLVGINKLNSSVINSYSSSLVNGAVTNTGGFIGNNSGTITNSFYFQNPNNGNGTQVTSNELKNQSTFLNWDFSEIWQMNEFNPGLKPYNYVQ